MGISASDSDDVPGMAQDHPVRFVSSGYAADVVFLLLSTEQSLKLKRFTTFS